MFVEARTRPVPAEVCRRLGYREADAVLLRHHTNAVYAVEDVVVKIAPDDIGVERVRVVVAVVGWLAARRFPTVELHPGLSQPLRVGGHAVTVWQRLDLAHHHPVTVAELGTLLRELHALPAPPMPLPVLRPIHGIEWSIARSEILNAHERDLLMGRLEVLTAGWEAMRFPHHPSLIQSDPQIRNALRRFDGTPVLADWDGAVLGPGEWDVATVAVHCRRFGPPAVCSRPSSRCGGLAPSGAGPPSRGTRRDIGGPEVTLYVSRSVVTSQPQRLGLPASALAAPVATADPPRFRRHVRALPPEVRARHCR
jgi:hypothetical protein